MIHAERSPKPCKASVKPDTAALFEKWAWDHGFMWDEGFGYIV